MGVGTDVGTDFLRLTIWYARDYWVSFQPFQPFQGFFDKAEDWNGKIAIKANDTQCKTKLSGNHNFPKSLERLERIYIYI